MHYAIKIIDSCLTPLNAAIHGRYPNTLEKTYLNKAASIEWFKTGNIFLETDGFISTIQDQLVMTRSYLKYIVKYGNITTKICRMCGEKHDYTVHLFSGCLTLAQPNYIDRHNNGKLLQRYIKEMVTGTIRV